MNSSVPCLTMALACLASFLFAQKPQIAHEKLTAEEVEREIHRLYAERTRLQTTDEAPGGWKELRKVWDDLQKMEEAAKKSREPLEGKRDALWQTKEVTEWRERMYKIESRIDDLRHRKYELARDEGQVIYTQRHEALAKVPPPATPELTQLGFTVLTYPRVDGSTSTQPLATLIACRAFNMPYEWTGTRRREPREGLDFYFGGRGEPEAELYEFALRAKAIDAEKERLAIIVNRLLAPNASTHDAYVNLVEGRSDLGLLARRPSAEELKLAAEKKVEFDIDPCALDAFIFLVHKQNATRGLTTAQLRTIYSGKTKQWNEVGGRAGKITAYQREENSGSQELMRSLVMKELEFYKPTEKYASTPQLIGRLMSSPYLEITQDEGGLAYSVYYYERLMAGSSRTKLIEVDGVLPSEETIRTRKYPYVSEVFLVTRRGLEANSPTARLRKWILSPEGQAVVKQSGYVPLDAR